MEEKPIEVAEQNQEDRSVEEIQGNEKYVDLNSLCNLELSEFGNEARFKVSSESSIVPKPEVMKMLDMLRMSYIDGMHYQQYAEVKGNDTIMEEDDDYDDWEKVSVSSLIPIEQRISEPRIKFNFIEEYS